MNATELSTALTQFIGSYGSYFRHTPIRIDYTDGIKFLQEQGCYWLTDVIASYQTSEFKAKYDRQWWKLSVDLDSNTATLTADDGDGNILVTQEIKFTDFPLSEIKIYVEINSRIFMCLLSEY